MLLLYAGIDGYITELCTRSQLEHRTTYSLRSMVRLSLSIRAILLIYAAS